MQKGCAKVVPGVSKLVLRLEGRANFEGSKLFFLEQTERFLLQIRNPREKLHTMMGFQ
jgi:hypothetical protein